jgi:hypothetical protein
VDGPELQGEEGQAVEGYADGFRDDYDGDGMDGEGDGLELREQDPNAELALDKRITTPYMTK